MKNKIVLLTGATDGIGLQAANFLAQEGAQLILHGKDLDKLRKTTNDLIRKTGHQNISYLKADLTSFSEIEMLSTSVHKQFFHIDILINNAGIYENEKILLPNGIEKNFMVNYLAGFALTLSLLDLLKKSKNARIINVSSMIHAKHIDFENLNAEKYYSGDQAYALSKLGNLLFTYELSDRLKAENITVNALHPGVINTKLLRKGWGALGNSVDEGAKRLLYLAKSAEVQNISGSYFVNDKPTKSAAITYDKLIRKKFWELSLQYLNK